MNKILKILAICVLIFLITAFSGFSWLYYSGRINTYQPITIKNADNEPINFKAYGVTPFGRVFPFIQPDSFNVSCYYAYCRQIEIQFQAGSKTGKHDIVIEIGNVTYNYQETGNNRFVKPAADRGHVSYWGALLSVFYWIITQRILKFVLVIIGLLIIYILILFSYNRIYKTYAISEDYIGNIKFYIKRILLFLRKIITFAFGYILNFLKHFLILASIIIIHIILIVCISLSFSYLFNHQLLLFFQKYIGLPWALAFYIMLLLLLSAILFIIARIFRLKKNVIFTVLLVQISLFISLVLSEILLRFNPALKTSTENVGLNGYFSVYGDGTEIDQILVHKAFVHLTIKSSNEFNYEHKINSIGLRNDEITKKKDNKNEFRIIAIGDSFTEGVGASQDSVWPCLLQKKLNNNNDSIQYNVINAGISGSDPLFGFVLLKNKLLQYQPDLILYTFNNSDIGDISVRGGKERFKANGTVQLRKGPYWESLYALSYTARVIVRNLLKYDHNLLLPDKAKEFKNKAFYSVFECSKDFEALSKKNNFLCICVLNPFISDFEPKYCSFVNPYFDKYKKYFPPKCINLNQYYIDSLKMNSKNVYNYYWKIDRHHNGRGYAAFAEGVYLKLTEMGVLNKQLIR